MNASKIIVALLAATFLIGSNIQSVSGFSFNDMVITEGSNSKIVPYSNQSTQPITIDVSTNKSTYKLGEEVIVSGKVSKVVEDEVLVALFGPSDFELAIDYFPIINDGSFKGSIKLKSDYTAGRYTLEVNYASSVTYREFFVETSSAKQTQPITIDVSTNKSTYKLGEEVIVSGKVSKVVEDEVLVALFAPNDLEISLEYFQVANDGSFKGLLPIKKDYNLGRYTLEIRYASNVVYMEFFVELTVDKPPPPQIDLTTDWARYVPKTTVTITGQVSSVTKDQPVKLQILHPDNSPYTILEVRPSQNGSFSSSFSLDGKVIIGKYTIKATYSEGTATTTFEVIEPAKLTISTDKTTYFASNKVKISGTASGGMGSSVLIKVLNPNNKLFLDKEVKPNSDGKYSLDFTLEGELAIVGLYSINVKYDNDNVKYNFELKQEEKKPNKETEESTDTKTKTETQTPNDTETQSSDTKQQIEDISSSIKIDYAGIKYDLPYTITNALLAEVKVEEAIMLINIDSNKKDHGILHITLPRELIDARVSTKDVNFKVLIDSKQVAVQETKKTSTIRELEIQFAIGSKEIKIIGTKIERNNDEDHEKLPSETKTILFLNPLPNIMSVGEELTFTGLLKTSGRGALQNVPILIKSIDPSGSEKTLGSSFTDSAGRFTIKWTPKPDYEGKRFNTFAVFDGSENYLKSRSPIFSIHIEKPNKIENQKLEKGSFSVKTDKESYDLNETVILTGFVRSLEKPDTVGIFVMDQQGRYFVVAEAKLESDTSFSYEFWLSKDRAITGTYTVKVEYSHEVVTTTFHVGEINRDEISEPVLLLNQPPPVITQGDIVVFTGSLKAKDKPMGIPNASISIKYKESDEKEFTLALGQTDGNGRFMIKWIADNIGDSESIKVYAHFERSGFESTISEEFKITIRDRLYKISAATDKEQYAIADIVKVTGTVNELVDGVPVVVQVFNPHMLSIKEDIVDLNSDREFEYQFKLKGVSIFPGRYTIKASYLDNILVMEVQVYERLAEPITVEKISIEDAIGLPINSSVVGEEIFIQSILRNNLELEQEFVYIVQITDSDGFTVFLDSITKKASNRDEIRSEVSWRPESEGNYSINIFVWENFGNPVPLSANPSVFKLNIGSV